MEGGCQLRHATSVRQRCALKHERCHCVVYHIETSIWAVLQPEPCKTMIPCQMRLLKVFLLRKKCYRHMNMRSAHLDILSMVTRLVSFLGVLTTRFRFSSTWPPQRSMRSFSSGLLGL